MLLFHVLLRAVIVVSISTLEIGRFKKSDNYLQCEDAEDNISSFLR